MKSSRKKIGFFPMGEMSNSYTKNFISILNNIGDVCEVNYKPNIRGRGDVAIVNWLESSVINLDGKLSALGVIKFLLKVTLLKVNYKKVIYVLHNTYPHSTKVESIQSAKKIINTVSGFCDAVVVHSGDDRFNDRFYIPHPLYRFKKNISPECLVLGDYYVIFGRIVKYKKIEETLEKISNLVKIVVCGKCEDKNYLNYLVDRFGDNVDFMTNNISDDFARVLHERSRGALVCHSDDDMIVSGSILFSLSCGKKVYVKDMPYADWLSKIIGSDCIENFIDIDSLISGLNRDIKINKSFNSVSLEKYFSDRLIEEKIKSLLT